MTPWKLTEVIALATIGLTVWIPAVFWMAWSIKAGHFVDFPVNLAGFVGSASVMALGLLTLPQFATKSAPPAGQ